VSVTLLFKWKGSGLKSHSIGKTRSEQEENLRKEWGSTVTDEQLDKIRYIEKLVKEQKGSTDNFMPASITEKIK